MTIRAATAFGSTRCCRGVARVTHRRRGAGATALGDVGVDPAKPLGHVGDQVVDHREPRLAAGHKLVGRTAGFVAVSLEHQVRGAPDVDVGYHSALLRCRSASVSGWGPYSASMMLSRTIRNQVVEPVDEQPEEPYEAHSRSSSERCWEVCPTVDGVEADSLCRQCSA
jgi:hypothetical protein